MPAGIITRSAHPDALWPGVDRFFGLSYENEPKTYTKIFEQRSSNKFQERQSEAYGFGLAKVKTEASPIQYDSDGQGYTTIFEHTVYALGYIVTREEKEDGQYSELSNTRAASLAHSMNTTAEYVHANVFNRGFSASYPIGDGQPLFSAAHPTVSGAQSNLLTAADISETAIEDGLKAVWRLTDARGFPINGGIKRIIANPEDALNLTRILNSTLRSGTNNNDINALNAMGAVPDIVINKYLTDTDSWYIQTDVGNGPQTFWRRRIEFVQDNDFDTENAKAKSSMRFSAGVGDWRALFGNPGAG